MKKRNKIIFLIVSIIIFTYSVMFIFKKKESYSEFENRYLTKFSLNNVESYLLDIAPFRNELLKLKNKIELLCGKTLVNGI